MTRAQRHSDYLVVSFESEFDEVWHGTAIEATRTFSELLGADLVKIAHNRLATFRGRKFRRHYDPCLPSDSTTEPMQRPARLSRRLNTSY